MKDDLPLEARAMLEQIEANPEANFSRLSRRAGGVRAAARGLREPEDLGVIVRLTPVLSRGQRARGRRWRR